MRALVVGDGDVPERNRLDAAWPGWDRADLIVAADGGYRRALGLGLRPGLLVGDGDSLSEAELDLVRGHVDLELAPAEKDESDMELAVLAAVGRGADEVTVLGAFGGPRLDHALANIGLLAMPGLRGASVTLFDEAARVSLLSAPDPDGRPARRVLPGRPGELVSLLPFGGDVEGVRTEGLAYPLRDEPLLLGPARGLSNVCLDGGAAVSVRRGRLLIVETRSIESQVEPTGARPPADRERSSS